ncbi:hypothetical protein [Halanaerobium congolense]|jgi:hypothetical protein|uniref:Uncharacterized protein n=1 Tax=Halanaerobium congolense TaxID=54121 RepID=A0A4R7DU74_9FIRM|nr:hypothetical protein [Halanaerobium congolense]TDP25679.1 hypothetical protein C8C79_10699 [Halanaerobium congolense]TDS24391.1 hypothetical protein BY453_1693 [Halanaerobium congolense]SDL06880.1 hypothetical protein SAMN04515655_1643 [Halanaerobium congolense]SDN19181.1 hypothetical protein SAMN04488599_1713 [Halanaerobium congolense]
MVDFIKRNKIPIIIIAIVLIFSFTLVKFVNINDLKIIEDGYLINLILIFLSLSVAIITLLFSTTEKIRDKIIENKFLGNNQIEKVSKNIDRNVNDIFEEMKQDTKFLFYCLIFAIAIIILESINIPNIQWPIKFINKMEFILMSKFSIILLSIISLRDILYSLLNIISIKNIIDNNQTKEN